MTLEEFDIEFDLLFNNISSNKAPSVNPLEKSIFLTRAQELVLMEVYRNTEQTEEMTEYINTHIVQKDFSAPSTTPNLKPIGNPMNSTFFKIPDDLLEIVSESGEFGGNGRCAAIGVIPVIPTTHDEFFRVYRNPFRGAGQYRALRLTSQGHLEVVSPYAVLKYSVRYLKKPTPIVLPGLGDTLSPYKDHPEGLECELPESLHSKILLKAIDLAKMSWS